MTVVVGVLCSYGPEQGVLEEEDGSKLQLSGYICHFEDPSLSSVTSVRRFNVIL